MTQRILNLISDRREKVEKVFAIPCCEVDILDKLEKFSQGERVEFSLAEIALIENLQREDLNPIEEAAGIRKLIEEFGLTQEETAERLSKSRPAIANSLRLLALPKDVMKMVEEGLLSAGHARALLGLENEEEISDIAKEIVEKQLSVRQTEQLVKALKKPKKAATPKKSRDKFYDEVELALSGVLARKVSIHNSGKGGKIEIEFFDTDDLQKLAKLFAED